MSNPYLSRRRFLILGGVSASATMLAASSRAANPIVRARGGSAAQSAPATTLRYINHWTGQDAHGPTMDWLYQTFQERYPNVTLDVLGIPNITDVEAKVQTECGAGQCPDLVHAITPAMVEAGIIRDLTDWMTANADRFVPVAQEPLQIDGRNYGWSAEYGPVPMIWNTRILEAAGAADVPTTWDGVKEAGEALLGAGQFLTSLGISPNAYFYSILFPMPGGREAMEAGDWTADVVVQAFAKLAEIVPYLPPNDAENNWDAAAKLFVTEQTAFEVNGPWTIGNEIEGASSPPDFKDVVAVTPFADTGNGTSVYVDTFTFVGASADTAEDPAKSQAITDFFDLWTSSEAAEQFVRDARSPMGVTTAEITPELAGSVLAQFYGSIAEAAIPYTITAALRAGPEYAAVEDATKALRLGQSPEQAAEVFSRGMTQ